MRPITIAGAGVAGLACGYELARRGLRVCIYERAGSLDGNDCSHFAGGMLAPFCEGESAPAQVVQMGADAADWWAQVTPVARRGTLVLAPARDRAELTRFARLTRNHRSLSADEVTALEPALSGRFAQGLFFPSEAHLDPRRALADLASAICSLGGQIIFGTSAPMPVDIDCTGMAANLPGLRAVRGEMLVLDCRDLAITRTLRLLHPRIPAYLVPRGNGIFMLGATMIESDSRRAPTLRSLLELMSAAFALHPALGEAAVIETGIGLRPAFADNIPRVIQQDGRFYLNGFYRHGFLLAPAMARQIADHFRQETGDEHPAERATA